MLPLILALTLTRSSASTVPVAYTASTAVPRTTGVTTTSAGWRCFAAAAPPPPMGTSARRRSRKLRLKKPGRTGARRGGL